jgi:hypothetical protein
MLESNQGDDRTFRIGRLHECLILRVTGRPYSGAGRDALTVQVDARAHPFSGCFETTLADSSLVFCT